MIAPAALRLTTRYTLVGAASAALNNLIMILGNSAGHDFVTLAFLAFLVVTPLAYLMHARFTFAVGKSLRDFARFAAGVATGFPMSLLVMAVLCSGLRLPMSVAAPTATVTLYVWNYGLAYWALRRRLPLWIQGRIA
jgi:putative flippase GtrA